MTSTLKNRFEYREPRKTNSVHGSTSSPRMELIDLNDAVRTEFIEVQGFRGFLQCVSEKKYISSL